MACKHCSFLTDAQQSTANVIIRRQKLISFIQLQAMVERRMIVESWAIGEAPLMHIGGDFCTVRPFNSCKGRKFPLSK